MAVSRWYPGKDEIRVDELREFLHEPLDRYVSVSIFGSECVRVLWDRETCEVSTLIVDENAPRGVLRWKRR